MVAAILPQCPLRGSTAGEASRPRGAPVLTHQPRTVGPGGTLQVCSYSISFLHPSHCASTYIICLHLPARLIDTLPSLLRFPLIAQLFFCISPISYSSHIRSI